MDGLWNVAIQTSSLISEVAIAAYGLWSLLVDSCALSDICLVQLQDDVAVRKQWVREIVGSVR